MKIYTRKGDKGHTTLYTGEIVGKSHPIIDAVGDLDECNSALGAALSMLPEYPIFHDLKKQGIAIQHALFDLGANIATPTHGATEQKLSQTRFSKEAVLILEKWIDGLDQQLPPLKNFILPGGHPSASLFHLTRTICRRCERHFHHLLELGLIEDSACAFINRLSDYFFMVCRIVNHRLGCQDTVWQHGHTLEI